MIKFILAIFGALGLCVLVMVIIPEFIYWLWDRWLSDEPHDGFHFTKSASKGAISRKRQKLIADRIREGIENSAACAIIYYNIEPPSTGIRVSIDLQGLSIQEKAIAYLAMIDLFGSDITKQDVFYSSYFHTAHSAPNKATDMMKVYIKDFVE